MISKVGLALMVAIFSSSLLMGSVAYGTNGHGNSHAGGGNMDCPANTSLIAKYEWNGSSYVAESGSGDVRVTATVTSGSFTVLKANTTISAVIVKGGTDAKVTSYNNVTSGNFDNSGLENNGGNVPGISNVKFCGTVTSPQPAPECVDASNKSNLVYTWAGNDTVTVSFKRAAPACADTTLYFSSYTMPSTWNGAGFNATASPQEVFDSTSVTFKADGTPVSQTLMVKLPSKCNNVQVDLYYAPEIIKVTYPTGHGDQYIDHRLVNKQDCSEQPTVPATPPAVTPANPTPSTGVVLGTNAEKPQATASTELPAVIPATGAATSQNPLLIIIATVLAYGATYSLWNRKDLTSRFAKILEK